MNKNIFKFTAMLALMTALAACKPKEDDNTELLLALAFLADQTSGNCVTLSKTDAAPGGPGDGLPTYTATATTRPKAACNGTFNTVFIVGNSEAVAESSKASYQAAIDKANAGGANCTGAGQTVATLQATKDAVTALKVDQTLAANAFCMPAGTGWNLNPLALGGTVVSIDPAYFGKTVIACSSEQAKAKYLEFLSSFNISTVSGSAATDMATNLTFRRKTAAVAASNFKWTAEAANAGRLINVSELTTSGQAGATLLAFGTAQQINAAAIVGGNAAGATTARACAKALIANESEAVQGIAASLHDVAGGFTGAMTGGVLGEIITTAQAEAVKEVLFLNLTCRYGDFNEEAAANLSTVGTETNVKNNGLCPASYPKY
ncbi:lipoprotein LipL36 [Leptospira sp. 201903070]|jgi:hypothetical protein|uniref:Lipoprotein LipL36 n=1 Tax=Leptospira ainlahdjerensis TaxID=2810033 RepID=A0ABS2UG57_9LEPT|nr:lipoprotein LipL36 [Leptospira ainlahdjerensis]MBM9579333.1 lipoprotein LipL36 [Leptospira ainlahdjerensis]